MPTTSPAPGAVDGRTDDPADDPAGEPAEDPAGEPDGRPLTETFSTKWPAMIVLGIAALMVIGLFVTAIFDTGSSPNTTLASVTIPDGTVVRLTEAADALQPVIVDGLPPTDIVGALEVPVGVSQVGPAVDTDQKATQYDRTMPLSAELSADQLTSLYQVLLPRLGWQVISVGPDPYQSGSSEVLAKRGSSDGYYWEIGVVVSPTAPDGTTPFSIRLFQAPDTV